MALKDDMDLNNPLILSTVRKRITMGKNRILDMHVDWINLDSDCIRVLVTCHPENILLEF